MDLLFNPDALLSLKLSIFPLIAAGLGAIGTGMNIAGAFMKKKEPGGPTADADIENMMLGGKSGFEKQNEAPNFLQQGALGGMNGISPSSGLEAIASGKATEIGNALNQAPTTEQIGGALMQGRAANTPFPEQAPPPPATPEVPVDSPDGGDFLNGLGFRDALGLASGIGGIAGQIMGATKKPKRPGGATRTTSGYNNPFHNKF